MANIDIQNSEKKYTYKLCVFIVLYIMLYICDLLLLSMFPRIIKISSLFVALSFLFGI